jgi:regulator of protease activity HflC (stomatin/prohibitin superfamily)
VRVAWVIFAVVVILLIGAVLWIAFEDSFVKIQPGQLGLLLIHGRATDKVLEPGPHWVPALRRRMVQAYPSVEMSYSAHGDDIGWSDVGGVERRGPRLQVNLGDQNRAGVNYTVRFRLDPTQLKGVHERFGPDGIWAAVRDESARTLRATLAESSVSVADLAGAERTALEGRVSDAVTATLEEEGVLVTSFFLGDLDLGRAGEAIEATARARLELEREQAEAAMRLARAQIDADLAPYIAAATDAALRYREVDSLRELARTQSTGVLVPPPASRRGPRETPPVAEEPRADADEQQ